MLQKNSYVQQISDLNIMAVVRDTPEETLRIAQACLKGGVKAIEVSFTVSTALRSLTKISDELPEMVACAGTVLDAATACLAILGGAKLILSPAFNQEVAEVCNLYQVPYAPGCNSMTEITTALRAGASFIKVFPGSALGGTKEITTIKTPIPFMPLLVSGGATLANYRDFLLAGADCVSFGSALTGDSEKITKNALLLNKTLSNFRIDKR